MSCTYRVLRGKEKEQPLIVEISREARRKHLERKAKRLVAEILERERQKHE